MKKKRIFGLAGLAAVVLAAGAGIYYTTSQHDSKGNGDLKVVTSFYPVYEFTKQVVGDEVEVSYLIPAGSEVHDFQPSTKNVAVPAENACTSEIVLSTNAVPVTQSMMISGGNNILLLLPVTFKNTQSVTNTNADKS